MKGQHCTGREDPREREEGAALHAPPPPPAKNGQVQESDDVMMNDDEGASPRGSVTAVRGQKRDHDRQVAGGTACDVLGSIQKGNI